MVAELLPQPHPIVACATDISAMLATLADVQPVYMSTCDKRAALLALTEASRRLAELQLRVMAAAADVAEEGGARDVAAWLASRTHGEPATLRLDQSLAAAVDARWQRVAAGMAAGVVSKDQARAIVAGLEALPGTG